MGGGSWRSGSAAMGLPWSRLPRGFLICTHCDRGLRYCSDLCGQHVRRQQRPRANKRHRQGPEGLLDHRAFVAVMNQNIRPYLTAKGKSAVEAEGMHRAWCKSLQLQLALWAGAYVRRNEW